MMMVVIFHQIFTLMIFTKVTREKLFCIGWKRFSHHSLLVTWIADKLSTKFYLIWKIHGKFSVYFMINLFDKFKSRADTHTISFFFFFPKTRFNRKLFFFCFRKKFKITFYVFCKVFLSFNFHKTLKVGWNYLTE